MKKLGCTIDPTVELYVRNAYDTSAGDAESAFMKSTRIIASETVRILRIELEVPDDFKGQITMVTPGVDADGRVVHWCAPLKLSERREPALGPCKACGASGHVMKYVRPGEAGLVTCLSCNGTGEASE